jgi:ABC-type lipoprotein export system ATPase subunit
MTILKAENIHKSYTDTLARVDVLNGAGCGISQGDTVAIVGPSGAGKSTFLHILGGLDVPDRGRVTFDGRDLYALSDRERAAIRNREFGFVFQFYHLLPELNALDNVILPAMILKNSGRRPKELRDEGQKVLERVGLGGRASHKPHQLSGGEQQRAAIARSIINSPRVLLCDEPTGNLDSHSGKAVIDLLLSLNAKNGQTLILVTHDEQVAKRCHRIIHMKDGNLV